MSYESLMSLSQRQRQAKLRELAPEEVRALKRTHLRRWLDRHRRELTELQVDFVNQAIAVIGELERRPNDPALVERSHALGMEIRCRLGTRRSIEAFTFLRPPEDTWSQRLEDWYFWLTECVF